MKNDRDLREVIYDQSRKLDCLINRINRNKAVSERNKELLLKFKDNAMARGLSPSRAEIRILL